MGIIEFLTARLDEDEQTARAAGHGNGLVFRDDNAEWVQVDLPDNARPAYDVRHIKRFSPARVLAEVETKRRIVERYEFALSARVDDRPGVAEVLTGVVRLLALPYADHELYDEAWRP